MEEKPSMKPDYYRSQTDKIIAEMQKKTWIRLEWIVKLIHVSGFHIKRDIAGALRQTAKDQRDYSIECILKYCKKNKKDTLEKDELIRVIHQSIIVIGDKRDNFDVE